MGSGDLLEQDGRADPPTTGRIERILDGDVVVGDDGRHLDLAFHELCGELEVEHVAGVVLDDVQDAGAAVDGACRRLHLVRDRRGEDVTGSGSIEHAGPHEAAVERLVAGAAAGDERDLAALRPAATQHQVLGGIDPDNIWVGLGQAGQALGDDVVKVVVELLDAGRGVGRHGILLLDWGPCGRSGQAWTASLRPVSATAAAGTVAVSWRPMYS